MILLCLRTGILADNFWALPAVFAAVVYLVRNVIAVEEKLLKNRFGGACCACQNRVRRWL